MIHISELTAKMEGIPSISTSPKRNPSCLKNRKIKGSICEKCYSFRALSYRRNLENALDRNTDLFLKPLKDESIPFLNRKYFRFESHGDIINAVHLDNYCKIANKNSHVTFTLWSKNYLVVKKYFSSHSKPKNLLLVASSLKLNTPIQKPEFFDKVFTVYTKDFPMDNINCHQNCASCLKCYNVKDKTVFINERVHR